MQPSARGERERQRRGPRLRTGHTGPVSVPTQLRKTPFDTFDCTCFNLVSQEQVQEQVHAPTRLYSGQSRHLRPVTARQTTASGLRRLTPAEGICCCALHRPSYRRGASKLPHRGTAALRIILERQNFLTYGTVYIAVLDAVFSKGGGGGGGGTAGRGRAVRCAAQKRCTH